MRVRVFDVSSTGREKKIRPLDNNISAWG